MKYSFSLKPKRILTTCIFLLLLSLLVSIAFMIAEPVIYQYAVPDDGYILNVYSTTGYEISDNKFTSINDDPQITIKDINTKINSVYIVFSQEISIDTSVQLFYTKINESFSEEFSIKDIIPVGSKAMCIDIPGDVYSSIRVDINGNFELKNIVASDIKGEKNSVPKTLNLFTVLYSFIILTIIYLIAYMWYRYEISIKIDIYAKNKESIIKKYGIYCFAAIFLVLFLLQVNFSSIRCYDIIIPNNISSIDALTIGKQRYIRSDEWLGSNVQFNLLANGGEKLFDFSKGFLVGFWRSFYKLFLPIEWGNILLPTAYAFSWSWLIKILFSCFFIFRLVKIITNNVYFSIAATFIIVYSPGIQWWSSPMKYGIICSIVVLFYDFFNSQSIKTKFICCIGLAMGSTTLISGVYPAWDIPLVYMFALILLGIYLTDKKINFNKKDTVFIIATLVVIGINAAYYFYSQREFVELVSNTVYPGKRFVSGGGFADGGLMPYFAHYLTSVITPYRGITFLNQSEASAFINLFPLPFILYIIRFNDLKKKKVLTVLLMFDALCLVYMFFGIGDVLARVTMLSMSFNQRIFHIFSFATLVILLLEVYFIIPIDVTQKISRSVYIKIFILNTLMVGFLATCYIRFEHIASYIGGSMYVIISIAVVLMSNIAYIGMKKLFIFLMITVTVISGLVVNPINFGTKIITQTPIAKQVQAINEQDKGKWITLNDWFLCKYITSQGIDVINTLNYPPKLELFKRLDPNEEYNSIYNRYAHLTVELTEQDTKFVLKYIDQITVNLNINDLYKWDIKYIALIGELNIDSDKVKFEKVFYDNLDNINIYKVNYVY